MLFVFSCLLIKTTPKSRGRFVYLLSSICIISMGLSPVTHMHNKHGYDEDQEPTFNQIMLMIMNHWFNEMWEHAGMNGHFFWSSRERKSACHSK